MKTKTPKVTPAYETIIQLDLGNRIINVDFKTLDVYESKDKDGGLDFPSVGRVIDTHEVRLLAAAPDLLFAVEECVLLLGSRIGNNDAEKEVLRLARAALARAEKATI